MKTQILLSLATLLVTLSCKAQPENSESNPNTNAVEFSCDGHKFNVQGYNLLDIYLPDNERAFHYYWKKVGDKISLKTFLLREGRIDRWITYTIDKDFFEGMERKDILTTFPSIEEGGDESDIMYYMLNIDKDPSPNLLYSQYWCGWENVLMTDYEWGNIELTFSTKIAAEKFLELIGK